MPSYTPSHFRGLMVTDDRLTRANVIASQQSGPVVDTPSPADAYPVTLCTSGDADETSRTVTTYRGGTLYPGRAARWTWEDSDSVRGWWPQWQLTGVEVCYDGVGLVSRIASSYMAQARSKREGRLAIALVSSAGIKCYYQDIAASSATGLPQWSLSTVDAAGTGVYAMCDVEGGDLLLVGQAGTSALMVWRSTDGGATWEKTVDTADGFTAPANQGGASLAYHAGYLTLVILVTNSSTDHDLIHYVSADLGSTWTEVTDDTARSSLDSPTLVTCYDGSVMLFFISSDGLYTALKSSPYSPFTDDPRYAAASGLVYQSATAPLESGTEGRTLRACMGDDGTIYLLARISDGANEGYRLRMFRVRQRWAGSQDFLEAPLFGDTADPEALDYGEHNTTKGIDIYGLTPWQGSLVALTGVIDTGPFLYRWQGWSTVAFQSGGWGRIATTQYGKAWTYTGYAPSDYGFTATGAGTGSSNQYGWKIATTANTLYYAYTSALSGVAASGSQWVWARVYVVSGGSSSADNVALSLVGDNGTNRYTVTLRLTTTAAYLYNPAGAANLASVTGLTSEVRDWMVCIKNNVASFAYKSPNATHWTLAGGGTVTAAASSGNNGCRWGHLASSTAESRWLMVGMSLDAPIPTLAPPTGSGETRPAWGCELVAAPQYMEGGTYIYATGGPVQYNQSWSVDPAYRYGAEYALPDSPGLTARSWRTSDVTEATFALDLGEQSTLHSSMVSLVLVGPRFTGCVLEASTNWTTWTNLGTISCDDGLSSLGFTRTGNRITRSSGTGTRYVQMDELAGGWFWDGSTMAQIAGNTAGTWASGSPFEIRLTSSAGVAASGTGSVIWPQVGYVVAGVTTAYRYWRIRIPANYGAGYYEAAKVLFGPFFPFGYNYGWGRSIGTTLIQDDYEMRSGARIVRQRAQRRTAELTWQQGIPGGGTGSVVGASPSPTWVQANSQPVLARKDTAFMEAILRHAKGSEQLCCYFPSVDSAPLAGAVTLVGRDNLMVCRIIGGGQRQSLAGHEQSGEVMALAAVQLEEAV